MQLASSYVQTIQQRQGFKIGCVEEVAYEMGYIDDAQLEKLAKEQISSEYGAYLLGRFRR
jgi:glucose-1-phosphate thymidylyltransferase